MKYLVSGMFFLQNQSAQQDDEHWMSEGEVCSLGPMSGGPSEAGRGVQTGEEGSLIIYFRLVHEYICWSPGNTWWALCFTDLWHNTDFYATFYSAGWAIIVAKYFKETAKMEE